MILASGKAYQTKWGGGSAGSEFGDSQKKYAESGGKYKPIWECYQILYECGEASGGSTGTHDACLAAVPIARVH